MYWMVKRVFQAVITILAVISLSFALIRLMPGGPMDYLRSVLLGPDATGTVDRERLNRQIELYLNIHPEEPLLQQYISYMTSILTGDFGESIWYNRPVAEILIDAMPWTVFVMGIALLVTFAINIALGALMAYHEGTRFDVSMTGLSILSTSIPFYVGAIIFLLLFAHTWDLFPPGGRVNARLDPWSIEWIFSVFHHATLPILSSILIGLGSGALIMRGNSIKELGKDYLRVGRLRGLSERRLALRYVGRNAVLPMYTSLMIAIGNVFGGSVVLEEIFTYPGIGYYLFQAVEARDHMLMMGAFILITVAVVVCLVIADLTYGLIDPRAREGGYNEQS